MNRTVPIDGPEIRILTVSELNETARTRLESSFGEVWVEGEISNFLHHRSGHFYFSLKDSRSQVAVVMFHGRNRLLRFQPDDGMLVAIRGQVTIYEPRGTFQIRAMAMEPRGVGALQLAFEQLKARLQKEGLFDPDRKRPLPPLPRAIGIITSPTGAAVRDILNVLRRRHADLRVTLFPTSVQGKQAAGEIAAALALANQLGRHDVLILTRGGGSLEDLWPFNEEEVARAIAASTIPILCAVGHEIDFTIADFVADLRAPTPSAAAEMVIESKQALVERLVSLSARLRNGCRLCLSRMRTRIEELLGNRCFQGVESRLAAAQQRLDEVALRASFGWQTVRNRADSALRDLRGRLESLSPLAVLARGYAICQEAGTGRILKRTTGIRPGARVDVRLHQGGIACEVKEVKQ